jgi:hypothetical protein
MFGGGLAKRLTEGVVVALGEEKGLAPPDSFLCCWIFFKVAQASYL